MAWIISLGIWDSRYSSIFLSILFKIFCECFYGMNSNEAFETILFFKKSQVSKNILIHFCFNYFVIGLFWLCYSLYNKYKKEKKEKDKKNINKPKKGIKLIQYNAEAKNKTLNVLLMMFLIYFLWVVDEFCIQCFNVFFKDIDFWMIELFLYSLLNLIIFKQNIYKHQWVAIFISLGSIILKIISIIFTLNHKDEDCKYPRFEGNLPILYSIKKDILLWGTLFYFFLILIRAIVNIGLKWLMEKIYMPSNKILMEYGFTGFAISFICIILSSLKECGKRNEEYYENINNTNYRNFSISNYICRSISNKSISENKSTKEYLTYYRYYFENWKDDWIYELIAIFSWSIAFFFFKYYSLKIIKNLSPAHFIFSVPIAFFFQKVINIFYELNQFSFFKKDAEKIKRKKFWLDIGGDIITIIGLLIYLEIIVLKFCGLDYNIKQNIIGRASLDLFNNPDETLNNYITENEGIIENDNENDNEIDNENDEESDNKNTTENFDENAYKNINENESKIENRIENEDKEI